MKIRSAQNVSKVWVSRKNPRSFSFFAQDSWISRFPDFQIQGCQPEIARALCATAPRWLRTTKLVRSKELGQDRENPIIASPVWGNT